MLNDVAPALKRRLALLVLLFALLITAGYLHESSDGSGLATSSARSHSTLLDEQALVPAAYVSMQAANQAAVAVFNSINAARRKAHLAPLRWAAGLYRSALMHNVGMARVDELSHKLTNEPAFGNRISAQHVAWTNAGENIGSISQLTTAGAVAVNAAMLAEKAPNNGHRLNIMSTTFNTVGVNVIIDNAHKRLWLTEDFTRS